MTLEPVWHVETLKPPHAYPMTQIELACAIARALNRGKFVLAMPPGDTR